MEVLLGQTEISRNKELAENLKQIRNKCLLDVVS